jgi:hypothetical protein
MNIKQIVSLVAVAIGIYLVGDGIYARNRLTKAEIKIQEMEQSHRPLVKYVGKNMEKKIVGYESKPKWYIIGGAILVVCGGGAAYMFRKKKSKW